MAPRQRSVPQPSLDDLTSAAGTPPLDSSSSTTKPLLVLEQHHNHHQNNDNNNINNGYRTVPSDENNSHNSSNSNNNNNTDNAVEIARERHDLFNIFALLFVVAVTLLNWDFRLILQGPSQAFTGRFFYLNWATTECYFLIDLIWVALVPTCVKSPDVIIKHHFVAMAYLSGPIIWPEFRWFMGACLSVEVNTWFLILRRVLYKRKDRIHPFITEFVSLSFYLSWVVIRIFLYPAIMFIFVTMYFDAVAKSGVFFHWPMIFIPVHFFLCLLNLKWSYDLFEPLVAKWMTKNKYEAGVGVSSGL